LKTIFLEENSGDMAIMRHRSIQVQWSFVMSAIHATHIPHWPTATAGVARSRSGAIGSPADGQDAGSASLEGDRVRRGRGATGVARARRVSGVCRGAGCHQAGAEDHDGGERADNLLCMRASFSG
jgi:hypothetical protein